MPGESATTGAAAGRVLQFAGFCRTVADLGRSIEFYCGALGFECGPSETADRRAGQPQPASRAVLTLGDESIELRAATRRAWTAAAGPAAGRVQFPFQHIAIVTADMEEAMRRLHRYAPSPISAGKPVRLPAHSGGVIAYKFRDPDGHPLELIGFPAGVGAAKWHRGGPRPATLGIDHSAIAVASVERSLAFYALGLGFELAARQLNQGAEQDSLDGGVGVVVDVVGLRPANAPTPHLELLGYRKPVPPGVADFASAAEPDTLVWTVDDLAALQRRMRSLQPQACSQADGGVAVAASRECRMRDPDGHRMVLRPEGPRRA